MIRFILFCVICSVVCHAQTNTIWGYLGDYTLNPQPGSVQITKTESPSTSGGIIISPNFPPKNFGSDGIFTWTNLTAGTYKTVFDSGLFFNFYVLTNTFGSNNIANLGTFVSASPPPYILLNGQNTIFVTLTNGPGITFTNISTNVVSGYTNILIQVRTN